VSRPQSRTGVRIPAAVYPAGGLAVTVFAWWLMTSVFGWAHPVVLPPPQDVLRAFNQNRGYVLDAMLVTGLETVVGFLLSAAAGFVIGLLLASSAVLERSFSPLLVAVNAVPKIPFGASFVLIAATTIVLYYVLVGVERLLLLWVRATTER
jgi:NitT/TauT family transport system permease protein